MAGDPPSSLVALRPLLKAQWAARLRQAPSAPPGPGLVTPEMLVLMVDGTIDRLVAGLGGRTTPPDHPREPTRFSTTRAGCQCGLHLMLTYYLAGARALHAVLPAELGQARRDVLRCFNGLAREEMTALCGVCRHRGGSRCQLGARPE